jgi:hypothetical protein
MCLCPVVSFVGSSLGLAANVGTYDVQGF